MNPVPLTSAPLPSSTGPSHGEQSVAWPLHSEPLCTVSMRMCTTNTHKPAYHEAPRCLHTAWTAQCTAEKPAQSYNDSTSNSRWQQPIISTHRFNKSVVLLQNTLQVSSTLRNVPTQPMDKPSFTLIRALSTTSSLRAWLPLTMTHCLGISQFTMTQCLDNPSPLPTF